MARLSDEQIANIRRYGTPTEQQIVADLEEARAALRRWPATQGDPPFDGAPCPVCPWQIRNLMACAHNLTVAEYGSERFIRKLAELSRAVALVQPMMDAHFADRAHWQSHPAAVTEEKADG